MLERRGIAWVLVIVLRACDNNRVPQVWSGLSNATPALANMHDFHPAIRVKVSDATLVGIATWAYGEVGEMIALYHLEYHTEDFVWETHHWYHTVHIDRRIRGNLLARESEKNKPQQLVQYL